jgi:hypothetical protein
LNCVNHNILIAKLHYYGIQGIVGNSFRFWQIENNCLKTSFLKFSSKCT